MLQLLQAPLDQTPIRRAVETDHEEMAVYLLEKGAQPNQEHLYADAIAANMKTLLGHFFLCFENFPYTATQID